MKDILVVCYSRSGHTQKLAEEIARRTGGDLEMIRDRSNRSGLGGYLRSAAEALLHRRTWIRPARHAVKDYALVIIGTPIWFWNLASPVRAWAARHGAACRRVAFFCTCGGSGQDKVFGDLATLCGKRPRATLALTERAVSLGQFGSAVDGFVNRLQRENGASTQPGA
jgi:flavodoxin